MSSATFSPFWFRGEFVGSCTDRKNLRNLNVSGLPFRLSEYEVAIGIEQGASHSLRCLLDRSQMQASFASLRQQSARLLRSTKSLQRRSCTLTWSSSTSGRGNSLSAVARISVDNSSFTPVTTIAFLLFRACLTRQARPSQCMRTQWCTSFPRAAMPRCWTWSHWHDWPTPRKNASGSPGSLCTNRLFIVLTISVFGEPALPESLNDADSLLTSVKELVSVIDIEWLARGFLQNFTDDPFWIKKSTYEIVLLIFLSFPFKKISEMFSWPSAVPEFEFDWNKLAAHHLFIQHKSSNLKLTDSTECKTTIVATSIWSKIFFRTCAGRSWHKTRISGARKWLFGNYELYQIDSLHIRTFMLKDKVWVCSNNGWEVGVYQSSNSTVIVDSDKVCSVWLNWCDSQFSRKSESRPAILSRTRRIIWNVCTRADCSIVSHPQWLTIWSRWMSWTSLAFCTTCTPATKRTKSTYVAASLLDSAALTS